MCPDHTDQTGHTRSQKEKGKRSFFFLRDQFSMMANGNPFVLLLKQQHMLVVHNASFFSLSVSAKDLLNIFLPSFFIFSYPTKLAVQINLIAEHKHIENKEV
jgi:hypothetical protein